MRPVALFFILGLVACSSAPTKTEHIVYKRMQEERGLAAPDANREPASEGETTKKKPGKIKVYSEE